MIKDLGSSWLTFYGIWRKSFNCCRSLMFSFILTFAFQMLLLEFQTRFPTKSQEEIKWNRYFIPEVWRPWRDLRICTSENQNRLTLSVRFPGTRLLGLPESLYSLHTYLTKGYKKIESQRMGQKYRAHTNQKKVATVF